MDKNYAYFYTISIHNRLPLLKDDNLKRIIIESWQYLTKEKMIEIYAYVIMPNHIHLLWNMLGDNGKETPAGSFAKYTAHKFKQYLQQAHPEILTDFEVNKRDRKYKFWQRDPLAISLSTENILLQKMEYIHNNPLNGKWHLCNYPEEYRWSSAAFYISDKDEFGIVKHFRSND